MLLNKARPDNPFVPVVPVRPPAFFFNPDDVLVNFGHPGEQEMRFKRSRAIFLRLYPTYADQPRVGLTRAIEVAQQFWGASEKPFQSGNPSFIAAIGVEKAFVAALENYRLVYERELKLRPPFTVEFGAVGLLDQHLLIPSVGVSSGEYAGPIPKRTSPGRSK